MSAITTEDQRLRYRRILLEQLKAVAPQPMTLAEMASDLRACGYRQTTEDEVLSEAEGLAELGFVKIGYHPRNAAITTLKLLEAGRVELARQGL